MKQRNETKKLLTNGEFDGIKVEDIKELKIKGTEVVVMAKPNKKIGYLHFSYQGAVNFRNQLQKEITEYLKQ